MSGLMIDHGETTESKATSTTATATFSMSITVTKNRELDFGNGFRNGVAFDFIVNGTVVAEAHSERDHTGSLYGYEVRLARGAEHLRPYIPDHRDFWHASTKALAVKKVQRDLASAFHRLTYTLVAERFTPLSVL